MKRLIRLPEVKHLTGLSRSSIYLLMKTGGFPDSISLGRRAIAWDSDSIESFINDRIAQSKTAEACK